MEMKEDFLKPPERIFHKIYIQRHDNVRYEALVDPQSWSLLMVLAPVDGRVCYIGWFFQTRNTEPVIRKIICDACKHSSFHHLHRLKDRVDVHTNPVELLQTSVCQ